MRTTIDIQDELLARAKSVAAARRRRLSDLVNDALRELLERDARGTAQQPYRVRPFGSGGARAGVDFDDNGSLLDLEDDEARDPSSGELDVARLR